ncbi:MAG: glycosyltransferase family 2 protein [Lachnospiraceae bacterium]|jgi:glycosyltransferase involved in cell wall biosynthesis|nr:glycosyltransferase family 2 protein [Lachnospiraceae bacterium]
MSHKISVIIPCHNVSEYIERSIKSVANQTYKNIEIIAIDDCSTDNTYEVLKEFETKIPNLIVYKNKENKGQAYSRNFGIKVCTGDYIGFIDSDDYIDENYYEALYSKINENVDVVFTNIQLVDELGNKVGKLQTCSEGNISKENAINAGLAASPCNKLIKKELLEKYLFLEGKINEDVASIIPIIAHCKNIDYTMKTKYYYVQRSTSTQNSKFSEKRFDMFDAIETCFERIKDVKDYEKLKEIVIYQQLVLLYMYVLIELTGFFIRKKYLKIFLKKSKKYKLYKNKYLKVFFFNERGLSKLYYKVLVNLLRFNSSFIITFNISFKRAIKNFKPNVKKVLKKILRPKVINKNISMRTLVKLAKKQSKLKQDVKVSVVIPNYNYEKFLFQRLYSILIQTEKIYELIILDDCSKDNSRKVIDDLVKKLKPYIEIKAVYNEENSGSAFKQWHKGFGLASGDYVWIAEADDYCEKTLLERILTPIKSNKNIYISFADTAFMDVNGNIIMKTIKPEIDIMKTGHWNEDFVINGEEEFENFDFLNCTIANVSSSVIKNQNYDDIFEIAGKFRQCGDWFFYVSVMRKGDISFVNEPLNYYRVHGNNVTSVTKKQRFFDEIVEVHNDFRKETEFNDWHEKQILDRYEFLRKVWNVK